MDRQLPYRRSNARRREISLLGVVLIGCLLVILLGVLFLAIYTANIRWKVINYTLEAGDEMPDAATLCGVPNAVYADGVPFCQTPGEYTLEVISPRGRRTVRVTVVDTTPPVISGVEDITVYVGESIAYRKNIKVTDNAGDAGATLTVDSAMVNTTKEGVYTVIYTAADASGNSVSATASIYVKTQNATEKLLFDSVKRVCHEILKDGMNREAQLRAVYEYIQKNISYINHSDKTDWVGEAYNGLFVTGSGDCFTYFAAAKAFLTHLDIPFIELQRAPGLTEDTHYWMLVNISDTPGVRTWYHYDATRLRAQYNHSGCLLTDQQAQAYNKVRPHFYTHNTDCPATSNIIITPTPELEAYY